MPLDAAAADQDLLALIRQGDEAAFDILFRRYYGSLVGLAESMLRTSAVAEEVVQDVLLELWRRRETLVVTDTLRAYLFRSVRNRSLNELRRGKVEKAGEPYARGELSTPATAPTDLANEELSRAINAAVTALPDPCREVFEMSRTHGLKYAEIADTLGVSVKTVEARMGRALKELRERLANWLPNAEGM